MISINYYICDVCDENKVISPNVICDSCTMIPNHYYLCDVCDDNFTYFPKTVCEICMKHPVILCYECNENIVIYSNTLCDSCSRCRKGEKTYNNNFVNLEKSVC